MKVFSISPLAVILIPLLLSWTSYNDNWTAEKREGFRIFYTAADEQNKDEYVQLVKEGVATVTGFFGSSFKEEYDVYIHPDRQSLDSTWQKDWNMPDFKSECWMVGSGVAVRLDLISPKTWARQSCEHDYADGVSTQRLITHELVHVFHGQWNPSPDFSGVTGIDWFVEGLASYASGQCDSVRVAEVRKAIIENKVPQSLDQFWSGKLKYWLSGTMVMYIDQKYGREKLVSLLKYVNPEELLGALDVSEAELIRGWREYLM
jgi:hypothetical protein